MVPVASVEEAVRAEVDYRVGERGSARVVGFDFGNSPTEVEASELPWGARIVLSTTNGTHPGYPSGSQRPSPLGRRFRRNSCRR